MYYPQSQIKTNLYTNGDELFYLSNGLPYKGFYYQTSNNQYFTGKTTQDKPNDELVTKQSISDNNSNPQLKTIDSFYVTSDPFYKTLLPQNGEAPLPPTYSKPPPTQDDYDFGEFVRFFLKKVNEGIFVEVSGDLYEKFSNKDEKYQYELYIPIKVTWELEGTYEEVYNLNEKNVRNKEKTLKVYGFWEYFNNRFTEYLKDN